MLLRSFQMNYVCNYQKNADSSKFINEAIELLKNAGANE